MTISNEQKLQNTEAEVALEEQNTAVDPKETNEAKKESPGFCCGSCS